MEIAQNPAVHEHQRELLQARLDVTARDARAAGITDQDMAEWMLRLGARWLLAHGVSAQSILQWTALAIHQPVVLPLTAAARSRNDFGGRR